VADDQRRPLRAAADPHRRVGADDRGGIAFAFTSWVPAADPGRRHRRHLADGNEVGPFLAIEQAGPEPDDPGQPPDPDVRLVQPRGYVATATGALGAGLLSQALLDSGWAPLDAYRAIVIGYALLGLVMVVGFWQLDQGVEAPPREASTDGIRRRLGLGRSKAGRPQAIGPVLARRLRWRVHPAEPDGLLVPHPVRGRSATLGLIFFGANLLAAVSSLLAAPIAARIGLLNTMVFTHLPSNVLLILVPIMPNLQLAIAVLLLRYTLSQMDVPTRQSYVIAVVDPDERSAAAGVTGVARTTGAAISPSISSVLIASSGYAAVAVLPGRRLQDPVRPVDLSRVPERQAARGAQRLIECGPCGNDKGPFGPSPVLGGAPAWRDRSRAYSPSTLDRVEDIGHETLSPHPPIGSRKPPLGHSSSLREPDSSTAPTTVGTHPSASAAVASTPPASAAPESTPPSRSRVRTLAPIAIDFTPGTVASPRVVEMTADDNLNFIPGSIVVAKDETVTFNIKNVGKAEHEFMIGPIDAAFADAEGTPEVAGIKPGTTGTLRSPSTSQDSTRSPVTSRSFRARDARIHHRRRAGRAVDRDRRRAAAGHGRHDR
jgi:hypothetical protein